MIKEKKTIQELLEEALVPEEEKPYEVPDDWVWTKLNFVADWGSGGTPKSTNHEYYDGNIPWLVIGDLNDDIVYESARTITEQGLKNSSAKLVKKGSILIAMYGSIGKLGIAGVECATNQAIAFTKECYKNVNPKYLFLYLLSMRSRLLSLGKGGTQQNISQTVLKEVSFPLPPLNEQKRIADKLECLLSKIDEAKRLIEEANETFELRRAAILDKAFRGELSSYWREINKHVDDAGILYKKIKESQIGKVKATKAINETELRYNVPSAWKWVRLGDVFRITSGGTPKRTVPVYYEGDIPWVKTGEVKWNYLYDSEEHITPEAITNSSAKLLPINTVLVAMYGQGLTRGRASILGIEATCNQAVCALLPNEYILPEFLYYYFMEGYQRFRQVAKGGNQENLSATVISDFLFPLPPLEEQEAIVTILNSILNKESLIKEVVGIDKNIEEIRQSILFKAFKGELGTNDPSEENTLELLKEVLQEQMK